MSIRMPTTRRARVALVAGAAVIAVGLGTGAALAVQAGDTTGDATPQAAAPTATGTANPWSAGGVQDPQASAAVEADVPVRVVIPAIGVDSTLEDLPIMDDGRLQSPVDFQKAGWFSGGTVPGEIGPAIIAGHVDTATGPAVFARIDELRDGDTVEVTDASGAVHTFAVTDRVQTAKAEFPTSDVYGTVPAPELRLITCGGEFDTATGHYTDNFVLSLQLVA